MGVGRGTSNPADGEFAVISAVRAGDPDLVRILLHEDSDPDFRDDAFCLAVQMHHGHIAQLFLQYGADPGRSRREEIRGRYPESELLEARDLARRWHETGVEAELRRRTGSRDAGARTPVQDGEYHSVDERTLGDMTVRDGHGAILTYVEELLGVRTSFEELMDRALAHAGQDNHATWSTATILLGVRRDQATWTAAAALRPNPDPSRRLFSAEVLRLTHLLDDSDEDAFAGPALDMFTDWSAPRGGGPSAPRQPSRCPSAARGGARFSEWSSPPAFSGDARAALLRLMTDPDPVVRKTACHTVAGGGTGIPSGTDAMASVLDDADGPPGPSGFRLWTCLPRRRTVCGSSTPPRPAATRFRGRGELPRHGAALRVAPRRPLTSPPWPDETVGHGDRRPPARLNPRRLRRPRRPCRCRSDRR